MPNTNDYAIKANQPVPREQVMQIYGAMMQARARYDQARRDDDPIQETYFNQYAALHQQYVALEQGWQDKADAPHPEKVIGLGAIVIVLCGMVVCIALGVWLEIGGGNWRLP